MPNCNTVTGVSYGVLQGNHVPQLDQDIFEFGEDISFEAWKEELKETVKNVLEDPELPDHPEDENRHFAARYQAMRELILNLLHAADIAVFGDNEALVRRCMNYANVNAGTFEIEEIYEEVLEEGAESYSCEEPEHEYTDGATHYLRGHLGGAALIWVTQSLYVTPCRTCSPCVPGAGDLDSTCPPEQANNLAYCPPPEDWIDELPEEDRPYVIYRIDDKGYPTEEIAWQRKETT